MFFHISTTPPQVVLDTNIVMDMLHFQDSRTAWLKEAIAMGRIRCFGDAVCIAELERVVAYPEFDLDPADREALIETYLGFVTRCETAEDGEDNGDAALPRCRDKDDQKFLELAARCKADLLITRDKQLLRLARHRHKPPPFAIVTAEAAGKLLEPTTKDPARTV